MKQAKTQATFRSFKLFSSRAALPIAGLVLLAGGCDQRTEAGKAVEHSSRQLEVLNAAGSTPAPEAVRQKSYTEVVATAGGTKGGTDGEQAAAKMIVASAQRGLSEAPAAMAVEAEGTLRAMMNLTQVSLANWSSANAWADAAAGFDISTQLADIAASKAEREKEIAADTKRRGELQKQIADLRSLAKAKLEQADAKQGEYVTQMATISQLSAVQATPIVEAANSVKREGDKLRLEGLKISAQADQIEPVLAEVAAQAAKATKQRADLDDIEKSLNERLAASRKEATDMKALAQNAASEIDKGVADIESLRAGEFASQYGKSIDALKKGLAAAKDAQKDGGPSAKLSVALAQVDMAESLWGKAQSVAAFAGLLDSLAHAAHPLPNANAYATKLEAAQKEFAELTTQAGEAFDAAQTAIQGVRVQDKGATERLDKLKELLENAGKYLKGEEKDLAAAFQLQGRKAAAAVGGGDSATQATSSDEGMIRAAFTNYLSATKSGNLTVLAATMDLDSPAATANPGVALTKAMAKADGACRAKFQKSLTDVLSALPGVGPMVSQATTAQAAMLAGVDPAKAEVQIIGNSARVSGGGLPVTVLLVKSGERWLVDAAGSVPPEQAKQMAKMGPFLKGFAGAIDTWADEIISGNYADASAAGLGFGMKLQPLMVEMQKAMAPGGG